jgi:hypothetical protein
MNDSGNIKHVFPGSNTPLGFYSFFPFILPQNEASHIYVIKGGPGTGKSSFMKRIGNALVDKGIDVEFHHCSSDPNSLDCVLIPKLGVAILDGTAPHIVDPINPGAVDSVLNFCDLWDEKALKNHREEITTCNAQVSRLFKKSYFYIHAAKCIYDAYAFLEESYVDETKKFQIENEVFRNLTQNVPAKNHKGYARSLFGTSITSEGFTDYLHTIIGKTKNIHFIKETLGCNTKQLMLRLKDAFVQLGYKIECYHSPIDVEKIEDIIIPELDTAITVSNCFHKPKVFPTHIYDLTPCVSGTLPKEVTLELERNKKLMNDLFERGIASLASAKKLHDELESYYIPAVDFKQMNTLFNKMMQELTGNQATDGVQ